MRRIVAAFVLAASGSTSLAAASCPMAWSTAHAAEAAPRHAAAGHRHDATLAQKSGAPLAPAHDHGQGARDDAPNDDAPDPPDRSCAPTMTCGAVAAAVATPAALATADAAAVSPSPDPRHATDAPLAHDPPPPRLPV